MVERDGLQLADCLQMQISLLMTEYGSKGQHVLLVGKLDHYEKRLVRLNL